MKTIEEAFEIIKNNRNKITTSVCDKLKGHRGAPLCEGCIIKHSLRDAEKVCGYEHAEGNQLELLKREIRKQKIEKLLET